MKPLSEDDKVETLTIVEAYVPPRSSYTRYFVDGMVACALGQMIKDSPYTKGSYRFKEWRAGYHHMLAAWRTGYRLQKTIEVAKPEYVEKGDENGKEA